jgi:spore coat protein U-like protein
MHAGSRALWLMPCLLASPESFAILQSCNVASSSVAFGNYNPTSLTALDGTGTVTVSCSVILAGLLASWTISLSTGTSGTYSPRRMANGAAVLAYNLYTTAARTSVWGDGNGGTSVVSDSRTLIVGNNTTQYTMYGRIPTLQDVRAGAYSDTITVAIDY